MHSHQLFKSFTVVSLDWREGDLDYLVDDSREVSTLKRSLQAGHLVEDAAKSPYVTLVIVCFTFALESKKEN